MIVAEPKATLSPSRWASPIWLLAGLLMLLLAVNATVIVELFRTWWFSYAEMGHGFIAPPLALYVLWHKREDLASLPVRGSAWAFALVVVCTLLIVAASFARWVFPSQLALWALLVGLLAFLLGWNWVRALAFPLLLLLLTIPPPSFLYTRVTFELQLLASRLGEFGLELLGYSVLREGNVLRTVGGTLSVAEACSGIRSLVTLFFFFVVYGYFLVPENRIRWILLLAVAPVAVVANGLRIICTGVLVQYNPVLAEGLTHEMSGYVTLFLGGAFLVAVSNRLEQRRLISNASHA